MRRIWPWPLWHPHDFNIIPIVRTEAKSGTGLLIFVNSYGIYKTFEQRMHKYSFSSCYEKRGFNLTWIACFYCQYYRRLAAIPDYQWLPTASYNTCTLHTICDVSSVQSSDVFTAKTKSNWSWKDFNRHIRLTIWHKNSKELQTKYLWHNVRVRMWNCLSFVKLCSNLWLPSREYYSPSTT